LLDQRCACRWLAGRLGCLCCLLCLALGYRGLNACDPALTTASVSTFLHAIYKPKNANSMNDPCGARCPDLPRVL
jgi:hypothetical protein